MSESVEKPRAIGFNHIALEVGTIDEALAFYGSLFEYRLRSRFEKMAFIDLGDQFIALSAGRQQEADGARHFGLVVDDLERARARLDAVGVETFGAGLDFRDPWGNHIQLVEYRFVVKCFEVRRTACHTQKNDTFDFRGKVRQVSDSCQRIPIICLQFIGQ